MSKKDYAGRTPDEMRAAFAALLHAMKAKEDGDGAEFVDRMKLVPTWVFTEDPDVRREAFKLVPLALGHLKDMAAEGDAEAAEALFSTLESNPALQSIVSRTDDDDSN